MTDDNAVVGIHHTLTGEHVIAHGTADEVARAGSPLGTTRAAKIDARGELLETA